MAEKNAMAVPREVRQWFQKGVEAVQRDNYDYAIQLLNQVLVREPGFFDCRQALRKAQAGRATAGKTGFFRKMLASAGSSPALAKAQLALRHNPAEALAAAEQILNTDPFSTAGHKIVVEAAQALTLPRTAMLSLEILYAHAREDRMIAIQYANALAEQGNVAMGERVLMDLRRAYPNDPEVHQALKDISARRTLHEGGYQQLETGEGSYRDILKDEAEAKALEQENKVQKSADNSTRLIAEYEARLKTETSNWKLVRSLAELHAQQKQFDRALDCYERIKTSELGNDPSLDRAIAETRVRQFEHEVAQLDPSAPDYADRTAQINAAKLAFQLEEARQRAEKFPTDLAIRFELGQLYFECGKLSEAIQEFQKAQANPHKRIAAMNGLARCFAKRKMYDLAARTLQNALKEKLVFDDEKKGLVYELGCVLECLGKKEEAIEQFKLIYETDIGYRDVAAKVDAYYAAQ